MTTATARPSAGTPGTLDEAFERMAAAGFELPSGFVNHGPMACEALATWGFDEDVERWSRRPSGLGGVAILPAASRSFAWEDALGDYSRLPEWDGYFEASIDRDGWPEMVATWVPRLAPSLGTALFHAVIRVSHAVRALGAFDTPPRRAELARALAYWAARCTPVRQDPEIPEVDDVGAAILATAGLAARHFLALPRIFELHGVTGSMAVSLLAPHLAPHDAVVMLGHLHGNLAGLFADSEAVRVPEVRGIPAGEIAATAVASGDPHAVKLAEACLRPEAAGTDTAFQAAAELVVGRS
jgi:hypothetical protein